MMSDSLKLCLDCDGTGKRKFDVGTHKSEYETKKCKWCGGSDRVVMSTVTTEKPFVPGLNKSKRIY